MQWDETKNQKLMLLSNCVACDKIKSRCIKNQELHRVLVPKLNNFWND